MKSSLCAQVRRPQGIISKAVTPSPNRGKQAPFIRIWDEYAKEDFGIIMRLR